jgi:hypothetical protein
MRRAARQHPGYGVKSALHFLSAGACLVLVADPDALLLEEGILQGLQARGYDLLSYEDPVAFRFTYESTYRSRWDQEEGTERSVVLRTEAAELRSLPYDLLQAGQPCTLTIGDLFPNLSYAVVAALERSDFDALYRAQQRHHPGTLGEKDTKDFVLRHVFDIVPEWLSSCWTASPLISGLCCVRC